MLFVFISVLEAGVKTRNFSKAEYIWKIRHFAIL
jgi:hypothetical protein